MRFIIFLLLIALIVGIGWFIGMSDLPQMNSMRKKILGDTNVVLHGVRLMEKKYNKPSLQLVAAKSVAPLDQKSTHLERFTLISYSDDADEVTLTAENGIIMNDTKNLTANGNVLVRDGKGRALVTESLSWDNQERVITTERVVRVFGANFVLTGKGMIVRPDDETVEILSDVRATFEPQE